MRFTILGFLALFAVLPLSAYGSLEPPTPLHPLQEGAAIFKGVVEFTWESTNSPFYHYSIDLLTGEQKSGFTSSTTYRTNALELGEGYRWRVSSCSNQETADCGPPSATQTFAIVPAPSEFTGGIIPCGRLYDDTITTPGIDESDSCGIPHIFLLLKNVLDFTLWKLGLIVIAIMAVLTGAITYFSFGSPNIILRVKSIWRSVFVGYLIALFAWLIVNVILNVLGFEVRLFGTWWQLPF